MSGSAQRTAHRLTPAGYVAAVSAFYSSAHPAVQLGSGLDHVLGALWVPLTILTFGLSGGLLARVLQRREPEDMGEISGAPSGIGIVVGISSLAWPALGAMFWIGCVSSFAWLRLRPGPSIGPAPRYLRQDPARARVAQVLCRSLQTAPNLYPSAYPRCTPRPLCS